MAVAVVVVVGAVAVAGAAVVVVVVQGVVVVVVVEAVEVLYLSCTLRSLLMPLFGTSQFAAREPGMCSCSFNTMQDSEIRSFFLCGNRIEGRYSDMTLLHRHAAVLALCAL